MYTLQGVCDLSDVGPQYPFRDRHPYSTRPVRTDRLVLRLRVHVFVPYRSRVRVVVVRQYQGCNPVIRDEKGKQKRTDSCHQTLWW